MKKISFLYSICFFLAFAGKVHANFPDKLDSAGETYTLEAFPTNADTFDPFEEILDIDDIDLCISLIERNTAPNTLVVFDMDETLGTARTRIAAGLDTADLNENYYVKNFQLSTDLLYIPTFLENVVEKIAENQGKAVDLLQLIRSGGKDIDPLSYTKKQAQELLKTKKSWNEVIDTIHAKGGKAIVLTASYGLDDSIARIKHDTLSNNGLQFDDCAGLYINPLKIPLHLIPDSNNYYHYDGVICSGTTSKGIVLKHFLDNYTENKFNKIIFIDNGKNHISSVKQTFQNSAKQTPQNAGYTLIAIRFTGVDEYLESLKPKNLPSPL